MKLSPSKIIVPLFFSLILGYFIFLQAYPTFPDPDSFYHIKMSVLMQKNLIIQDFPWIQQADFTHNFTDHQFLYHLLLIPFTYFFPPLWGGKIATIIFATLAIIFFYCFLKKWHIKSPLFYTLILISSSPFLFRLNLAKTTALSLIVLLLAINFLWQKKYLLLTLVSFLYVWLYGGWSLLLILLFCHLVSEIIINKKFDWKPLATIGSGLLLGLIINPFFPHNLQFYWQQMVQIGLVNYQNQIQVGMEWYPYQPLDLLANNIFIFLLAILTFAFLIFKIRNNHKVEFKKGDEIFIKIFTLNIFAVILCLLTLKSQRFVEYFVPLAILAATFLLNPLLPKDFSYFQEIIKTYKNKEKMNLALIFYLIITFMLFFVLNTLEINKQMTRRYSWTYLQNTSEWLKQNTPPQTIIFHALWSDWPMLFYHNSQNYYLSGLDPTFFYLKNPQLYEEWVKIGRGQITDKLTEKIKNDFGATWILVKNNETEFLSALRQTHDLKLRFTDQEAQIYEIQ